jgi:uncharacterized membrane protein (UPF0127 family)
MCRRSPRRFSGLPRARFGRIEVPVAATLSARLLGLALLDRDQARPGLLIPRCRRVHTFGMRFALDLVFLDARGVEIAQHAGVPPRRIVGDPAAASVLELPARER